MLSETVVLQQQKSIFQEWGQQLLPGNLFFVYSVLTCLGVLVFFKHFSLWALKFDIFNIILYSVVTFCSFKNVDNNQMSATPHFDSDAKLFFRTFLGTFFRNFWVLYFGYFLSKFGLSLYIKTLLLFKECGQQPTVSCSTSLWPTWPWQHSTVFPGPFISRYWYIVILHFYHILSCSHIHFNRKTASYTSSAMEKISRPKENIKGFFNTSPRDLKETSSKFSSIRN